MTPSAVRLDGTYKQTMLWVVNAIFCQYLGQVSSIATSSSCDDRIGTSLKSSSFV